MIWDAANGMQDLKGVLENTYGLNLTGWTLTGAYAISDEGSTITGTGGNASGNQEAWVARVPEPGTLVSVLTLLGAVVMFRRRAR